MVEEIIHILGKKQKQTYMLKGDIYAIYHYRGVLFCINEGLDYSFENLNMKEQEKIYNLIKKGQFEKNNKLQ